MQCCKTMVTKMEHEISGESASDGTSPNVDEMEFEEQNGEWVRKYVA